MVLGIELDSVAQVACLSADKLHAAQELIQAWRGRRWCSRHQLESLTGLLHHAARVGLTRSYLNLRCMIELPHCFHNVAIPFVSILS